MTAERVEVHTAWLWARYDLCSRVNALINREGGDAPAEALAERKADALAKAGVPHTDMAIAEVRQVAAPTGETVLLVQDEIARWVLRPGMPSPETLPRTGVVVRSARSLRN